MAQTIYGVFDTAGNAEKAVGALLDYGVRAEDVSLVSKREGVTHPESATYVPGTSVAENARYDNLAGEEKDIEGAAKSGISTTTSADAGAGAAKGAGIGLGVGAIAAIASIFVPGFGLVAGGGALAIALSGAAATTGAGAIAGAVTGYLKDQGMDSYLAADYEKAIEEGGALVSVWVPSGKVDESTVRSVLDKYAASRVSTLAGSSSSGYVA